jgi:hypothetical protein
MTRSPQQDRMPFQRTKRTRSTWRAMPIWNLSVSSTSTPRDCEVAIGIVGAMLARTIQDSLAGGEHRDYMISLTSVIRTA